MTKQQQIQQTRKLLELTLSDLQLYQDEHKKYIRDKQVFQDSRTRVLANLGELQKLINAQEMAKKYVIGVIDHIHQHYTKENIGKEYDGKIKNMFGNMALALKDPEKAKKALSRLTTDINHKKTSQTTKKILEKLLDQLKENHEEAKVIQETVSESQQSALSAFPVVQYAGPKDDLIARKYYETVQRIYKQKMALQKKKLQLEHQRHTKRLQGERLDKLTMTLGKCYYQFIGIVVFILILYVVHCFGKSLKESMGDLEHVFDFEQFMFPTAHDPKGYLSEGMTGYYAYLFDRVNFPIKLLSGALGNTVKVTSDFLYNLLLIIAVIFGAILYVAFVKILEAKEITLPAGFGFKFSDIQPVLLQDDKTKNKEPKGIPKMIEPLKKQSKSIVSNSQFTKNKQTPRITNHQRKKNQQDKMQQQIH